MLHEAKYGKKTTKKQAINRETKFGTDILICLFSMKSRHVLVLSKKYVEFLSYMYIYCCWEN